MQKVKKYINLYHQTHNVRVSQSINPFGTGAMVDFSDQTLMTSAPEYWEISTKVIHDERLEKVLGVDAFRMPLSYDDSKEGIRFVRFPRWYFCPRCRRFKPIDDWETEFIPGKRAKSDDMRRPVCMECNRTQLVPARIVTACEHGHIQDFPWIKWVHKRSEKPICSDKSFIKISTGVSTAGLEGIKLECTKCGAKTTMAGSFGEKVFEKMGKEFFCEGGMPWRDNKKEECNLYPRAVQRGASNIYFAKVESSIVIPPYSDALNVEIEECEAFKSLTDTISTTDESSREALLRLILEDYINKIASQINKNKEAVREIVNRKLTREEIGEDSKTRSGYRKEEYKALTGEIPPESMNSRDFKIKIISGSDYKLRQIQKVVLVEKMREVRALTGFTRLNPPDQNLLSGDDTTGGGKSILVDIKDKKIKWYPANEVRGEGIFIEFNEKIIDSWRNKYPEVIERACRINERQQQIIRQKGFTERVISDKFIMLHTLAHLLIRELSFECGYSSTSLRERIYCNQPDDDFTMSGILIYTASGDSEGTLGGLVRQGLPDVLPRVVSNALQKAKWCSVDPVCAESNGQGRESLNLAACHACTLISETSCEEFNVLLDRILLVGTLDNPKIGFLSEII